MAVSVSVDPGHAASTVWGRLTGGLPNCSPQVVSVLSGVAALADQDVTGDLATGAQLADDVSALARAVTVLTAELARRTHAAALHDVLPTTAQTVLAQAKIPDPAAYRIRKAGAFAARWPQVAEMVAMGRVHVDLVATIAQMTRQLPDSETSQILDALLPELPQLTPAMVKQAISLAVEMLHPEDAETGEQNDYDQRRLSHTKIRGIWEFALTLPELEGAAFFAAVEGMTASLRKADADGGVDSPAIDRPTLAQRRADAVTTLIARAAAAGLVPTSKGTPAAAVVMIGLSEAERVAAGRLRTPNTTLHDAARAAGGAPAAHVEGSDTTLGDAAARFVLCASRHTGVLVTPRGATEALNTTMQQAGTLDDPIATALGLAHLVPLAEGRAKRCFTEAQRRAMAVRDKGCVIPDCPIPPAECEAHHVTEWAAGGSTDIDHGALLCWVHHREVDLRRKLITRNREPQGPYWTVHDVPRPEWARTAALRRARLDARLARRDGDGVNTESALSAAPS